MNIGIEEFLGSNLFLGVPSFEKEKLWHGFLYMAESRVDKGIKIGFTNYDLRRRVVFSQPPIVRKVCQTNIGTVYKT